MHHTGLTLGWKGCKLKRVLGQCRQRRRISVFQLLQKHGPPQYSAVRVTNNLFWECFSVFAHPAWDEQTFRLLPPRPMQKTQQICVVRASLWLGSTEDSLPMEVSQVAKQILPVSPAFSPVVSVQRRCESFDFCSRDGSGAMKKCSSRSTEGLGQPLAASGGLWGSAERRTGEIFKLSTSKRKEKEVDWLTFFFLRVRSSRWI